MLLDPDCGLRMRSREAAFAKLKNMVTAAKEVRLAL
jgi:5-methyltetrahydropteroyltriglutamate--homocysteine methyltransferase